MAITFETYARGAAATAIYPDAGSTGGLLYAVLGLTGEAGELANQAKKVIRDDDGTIDPARAAKMRAELGDVLWYVAAVARELDIELQKVARLNLQKLQQRAADGTLQGDGEDRRPLQVGDIVSTPHLKSARVVEISPHAPDEVCVSAAPGHRAWVMRSHIVRQVDDGPAPRPGGLY